MKNQRQKGFPTYPGSFFTHSVIGICIILEAGFIIAQAYFLASAVTALFFAASFKAVLIDVVLFFGAFVMRYVCQHIETFLAEKYAKQTARLLRKQVLHAYFHRGLSFVQQIGTGHLVHLVMEGVDKVKSYVEIIGMRMLKTFIIPAAIVIFVYFFDPISSVILIVTVPIVVIFMILLGLAAQKMADKQYETYTRLSNHFLDSLKGLETLTYLGKSREHAAKINRVSTDLRKATMKTLKVAFLSTFALDFFTSLSIAFVAVGLGLRLIDGEITLLPALTILLLAPEYFSPIKQVGKDYHATLDGQIAMAEIDTLLKNQEDTTGSETSFPSWDSQSTLTLQEVDVELNGKQILHDISFTATNGLIGIIGTSGAGKSTLIQLLAGRIPKSKGKILLNDKPYSSLNEDTWLQQIAYIPQHPYIFPLSLADNIRFYAPYTPDEKVEEMVSFIGLGSFVAALPKGIHEPIGEGGRTLSGGQEQRIALARALLSEKPILLLDEPTAHLDIETEYEIKQLILALSRDRLLILATHRMHWMKEMDQIMLMEKGRIIEQGTDKELQGIRGIYARFIDWRKGEADE